MSTATDFRRIALSLEGTSEAPHFDKQAFKVRIIYATLAADGRTANLKFRLDEQEMKCLIAPEAFAQIPNAWGRQGWTTATLSKLKATELKHALEMAWRHALPRTALPRIALQKTALPKKKQAAARAKTSTEERVKARLLARKR